MVKYIISFSRANTFSMEITPILKHNGQWDYPAMFKHVKAVVGEGAEVKLA